MRKHLLGSLTSLLIPFAAYGTPTAYGAYQRRQSIQVAGYQPLSLTDRQTPTVKKSPVSGNDELDLIAGSQARELIIIDAAVPDRAVLQSAARPGVEVVILDAGEDALEQTAELLKNYRNLDAVHLVSHGEAGAILLGDRRIDKTALEAQPHFLQALGRATRAGADLLLYGCDVAGEDAGLLEVIQNNSHLDVAASDNLTGAAALGGDWMLEIQSGNIESDLAFSDKALKDFSAVLRPHDIAIFDSLTIEAYEDDPSIDWGDFTTHMDTPGTYKEIISAGENTICSGSDGLYVNMYNTGSRFYIRSNPDGENFGVTGLSIFADSNSNPADEVSIYGYQGSNPTPVGERLNVPISDIESAIDLTSGVTGSFADITRLRIEAENLAPDPNTAGARDFCLAQVDFVPLDIDGNLTPAGGVSEPVGIDTTIDTAGESIDVFDFTLSDGGTGDLESLSVSQVVANVSGTATSAERDQITWRLNGPGAANVNGVYDSGSNTITFSGLSISVPHGGAETYTVNAYFNDSSNLTEGNTVVLSIDGDTDLTTGPDGTQMGTTSPVTNGTGTTIDVEATQLVFTTQPAGSTSGSPLSTQPVVAATDDFGNIDVDFTATITLTEASAGTLSNSTEAAANGAAAFTGLTYTATADQEPFTLTASGGGLPAEISSSVTSDVVATQLQFTQQPAPTTIAAETPTSFTTIPHVSAVDGNGTVDTGYSTGITLAEENGDGSALLSATGDTDGNGDTVTITPVNGVSDFPDLEILYSPLNPGTTETFNLRASSGALTTADSDLLTAFTGNQAPTGISLDSMSVNQSGGVNAVVGLLSTNDPDTGDSHSYSLVAGAGDDDNGSFNVSGDQLRANDAGSLAAGSYSVRIQTQDGDGETFEEAFTITVVDDIAPGGHSVNFDDDTINGTEAASISFTFAGAETGADYSFTISSDGGGAAVTDSGTVASTGEQIGGIDVSGLPDGTLTLEVTLTDSAGNSAAPVTDTATLGIQAPAVASVTLPANATYTPGQNLDFAVNYDEAVIVDTSGGTPRLVLTIGTTTRYATYIGGSGSHTLLFHYTVQAGDNDSDGIALSPTLDNNGGSIRDGAGHDANTNLGAIGSLAGVLVDEEVDTDGDGVSDAQEAIDGTDPNDPEDYLDDTAPDITTPADLLIDATGLHTPVSVRQLLGLPANATEEVKQSTLDALASDNIDGADCCGTNAATIAGNGGAAQAINGDLLWLAPGAHVITWQAEDRKGNVGTGIQGVQIRPLVAMQKDQIGAEDGPVTLSLFLNGLSDTYPLAVPYSIDVSSSADSADHDLVNGNVTFSAGQLQQSVTLNLSGGDAVEGDETLVVGLNTTMINAGAKTRHTITITEDNVAPDVALDLLQNAVSTALVISADGDVTVTANVADPNVADTHSYDWSETSMELGDIDGDTVNDTFVFDPALLDPGVYAMQVAVTDNNGAGGSATLHFRVATQAPLLSSTADSDGDGINDLVEGFGDTDGDGIPDYRDNIAASNVLPMAAGNTDAYLIECEPGVLCRLGSQALAGDDGATITVGTLPEEQDFNIVGGLFDFEVHHLPVPGQTTRVVIPLSTAIPMDAVYRKFDGQQWFTFAEDANNALHSSAGAAGFCPPPGDANWEPGLVQGHYCVQLTLEDGGPNDNDGLANGSVVDPGGIAVPVSSDGGDDGGSDDGTDDGSDDGSTGGSDDGSSGGEQTISRSIEGKSKGGGAFGLSLLLPLLLLALLRSRRRTASLCVLTLALLAPWTQAQESGNTENRWQGFTDAFTEKGYLSLDLHQATGGQKQGDFTSAMATDGVDVVVSDYDVERFAYQLSLGYRYHPEMAVEFGYLDLGEIDFSFNAEAANAGILANALADNLPLSAGGWTLANRFDLPFGKWRASYHIGVYFWESESSIIDPGDQDGIDPLLGLGVAYSLTEQFEAGVQYRRVFLDDQHVELWGLHLSWLFN